MCGKNSVQWILLLSNHDGKMSLFNISIVCFESAVVSILINKANELSPGPLFWKVDGKFTEMFWLKTIKTIPAHRDLSTQESGVMLWKLFKTESTSKCRNALVLAFASQSRLYFILTLDMYILDLQVRCF